jgi:hypothetical protein
MAQHDVQYGTAIGATPPQNRYSTPLTVTPNNGDIEDPEEWEYEYSTTETEVGAIAIPTCPQADNLFRHTT